MPDPFILSQTVGWGDCDPARIAYTGTLPKFALNALEAWWKEVLGDGWFEFNVDHNLGGPFVHMSFDFRSPVTPRHPLECEVRLTKLGQTSLGFEVLARQDGVLCFEGKFVEVMADADTMAKRPIPDDVRAKMQAYL